MAAQLLEALNQIVKEKGINPDIIFEAIETSLVTACKKNYGNNHNFKVIMNRETGQVECFSQREVVEVVEDEVAQISLEEAKELKHFYEIGDIVDTLVIPKDFGRIAAQTAKQVIVQKFREAERELVYNEVVDKLREVVTGIIQRTDRKNVIISLGKVDALLPPNEQIAGENYEFNKRIKVYVTEVKQTSKGPTVYVSRTHPSLIMRLFEQEVPEVYDGIVEIKNVAREAGQRTKMSVLSHEPNVDAVGACVGPAGSRVNVIISELNGEKIDIINWEADPRSYIESALLPAKVVDVAINEEERIAKVIVPKGQLSLAIGKEGQNARLAAKLTSYKIDIKSDDSFEENYENDRQYESFYQEQEQVMEEYDEEDY